MGYSKRLGRKYPKLRRENSYASFACSGARGPRGANWIACDSVYLIQHERGFGLERVLHLLEIGFGKFSGAMLKFQVAQVFIDRVAAFEQLVEMRTMRRGIGGIGIDPENEGHGRQGEKRARREHQG